MNDHLLGKIKQVLTSKEPARHQVLQVLEIGKHLKKSDLIMRRRKCKKVSISCKKILMNSCYPKLIHLHSLRKERSKERRRLDPNLIDIEMSKNILSSVTKTF